jgi:hypothetical protein
MPFDQDATTHVFEQTPTGGVETVTADDPGDADEIALIRMHLRHEAGRFAAGDFGDPAAIHGHDMPGLAALERGAERIRFSSRAVPRGAAITYRTTDPDLVTAVHAWFEAQLRDHGPRAHA